MWSLWFISSHSAFQQVSVALWYLGVKCGVLAVSASECTVYECFKLIS